MKRLFSVILILAMMFTLTAPASAKKSIPETEEISAQSVVYPGSLLAAINNNLSDTGNTSGSFTAQQSTMLARQTESDDPMTGISGFYTDPDTGETYYQKEPSLPKTAPVSQGVQPPKSEKIAESYKVDDTKTVQSIYNDQYLISLKMKCLYVGTHCTVWGTTSTTLAEKFTGLLTDSESIRIDSDDAKEIGREFDNNFNAITNAFGSYWYDADEDGKVAIYCYDIDREYSRSVSSYVAGYFFCVDMVDSDGYLKNDEYGTDSYINGSDCIHIDTYPGMGGSGSELKYVSNSYSTLIHEFQHMLNFSYQIKGEGKSLPDMEVFLNEAFSMAAEHMICGESSTSSRVEYFNSSSYIDGESLTYWNSTLSNYSNSYLFGQYLRTRYAQLGKDGNTVFRTVLENRTASNTDTLAILAGLLETTKEQLVLDFWTAVALKNSSGPYGFNGEEWADSILIENHIHSDFSDTTDIQNGGVKYYSIESGGAAVTDSSGLVFVPMNSDGPLDITPVFADLSVKRTGLSTAKVSLTPKVDGQIYLKAQKQAVKNSSGFQGVSALAIQNETAFSADLTVSAGEEEEWTLSFYTVASDGKKSAIYTAVIPAFVYQIRFTQGEHGTLQILNGGTPVSDLDKVQSGTVLTIHAVPDSGYAVKKLTLDGKKVANESTFPVSAAHSISVTFTRADVAASESFDSGSGTAADPYLIATKAQWKYFAARVNGGDGMSDCYVALKNDIDLEGVRVLPVGATPIEGEMIYGCFEGSFDGGGHTLSNLYLDTPENCDVIGLFGCLSGTLKNLTVSGFELVYAAEASGKEAYVGALVGYTFSGSSIDYCAAKDCTLAVDSVTAAAVGGLAGKSGGSSSDCAADVRITVTDQRRWADYIDIGGCFGQCSELSRCCSDSDMTVDYSGNSATVWMGGIVGSAYSTVSDCCSRSDMKTETKNGAGIVGGIVSYLEGSLSNSVCEKGTIATNSATTYASGIVCFLEGAAVSNCAVAAAELFRDFNSTESDILCYYNDDDNPGTLSSCYYCSDITGFKYNEGAQAAARSDMESAQWLSDTLKLDMTDVWEIGLCPDTALPTLRSYRQLFGVPITAQTGLSVLTPAFIGMRVTVSCTDSAKYPQTVYVDGSSVFGRSFTVTGPHRVTADIETKVGSGSCGTNVTWALTPDGILHIDGSGAMTNYKSSSKSPWNSLSSSIQALVVDSGVTSVGNYAMNRCTALITVFIPDTVTSVGNSAFSDCTGLADLFYGGTAQQWSSVTKGASYLSNASPALHYGTPASIAAEIYDTYTEFSAPSPDGITVNCDGSEPVQVSAGYRTTFTVDSPETATVTVWYLGMTYTKQVCLADMAVHTKIADGKLKVSVESTVTGTAFLCLYDSKGRLRAVKFAAMTVGSNPMEADIEGYTAKGYTAKVMAMNADKKPALSPVTVTLP